MTSVSPCRPRFQMTGISYPWLSWLSGTSLDRTAVAAAIAGTGWSARYHEAPDYEASLIVLPEDDDRFPTFVISHAGASFCLEELRDDALHDLGEFATLADTITSLRRAMAEQTGAQAEGVAGSA
jgi:hypothetical protein